MSARVRVRARADLLGDFSRLTAVDPDDELLVEPGVS